jgi:hypothetical protein
MFSVVELHKRVLANFIKQRTGWKREVGRTWQFPSVSSVYVRLVGGAEPSIGLRRLGKGGSEDDGDEYWRIREFEEEETGKIERKGREGLMMGVERQNESPEVVVWRRKRERCFIENSGVAERPFVKSAEAAGV